MRRSTMDRLYCGVACLFGALTFLLIHNTYFDSTPQFMVMSWPNTSADYLVQTRVRHEELVSEVRISHPASPNMDILLRQDTRASPLREINSTDTVTRRQLSSAGLPVMDNVPAAAQGASSLRLNETITEVQENARQIYNDHRTLTEAPHSGPSSTGPESRNRTVTDHQAMINTEKLLQRSLNASHGGYTPGGQGMTPMTYSDLGAQPGPLMNLTRTTIGSTLKIPLLNTASGQLATNTPLGAVEPVRRGSGVEEDQDPSISDEESVLPGGAAWPAGGDAGVHQTTQPGPVTNISTASRKRLFRNRSLVVWTNDYHIATTQDVRNLLEPAGVQFIDKSLTPKCKLYNSCADNLTVINKSNALTLQPSLIPQFYQAYKDDWQMKQVDAFVCYHPAAMCELFMPFNKSIIVVSSTRFELGRFEATRWKQWIQNLLTIAKDPKNFVGANNLYDAQYIKYFTGLNVPVVPSYCGYTKGSYNPTRPGFLTFAGRLPNSPYHSFFRNEYTATCAKNNCSDDLQLVHFRTLYPFFKFQDLASHRGVIFVPYQVSIMTIFELYRMNIPMFFPSLELLSSWQLQHMVVKERTFLNYRFHVRSNASSIPPHPSQAGVPDPNKDSDLHSIKYWFRFADFYQLPHIIYFDTVYELITKLKTTDLAAVSAQMKEYNLSSKEKILEQWEAIMKNVAKYSKNHPS